VAQVLDVTRSVGRSLLQSDGEWQARNQALADSLGELVVRHSRREGGRGLDVGCQQGALTDALAARTALAWTGVDPLIAGSGRSPGGRPLRHAWAHDLPFPDGAWDCVLLANVYEHLVPRQRQPALDEIGRVLAPGGAVVGQLPNPFFPIESHSRLPFMGWLPSSRLRAAYWRLAPVPWKDEPPPAPGIEPFYVVTMRDLNRRATAAGLERVEVRTFNYPVAALPRSVQRLAGWLAPSLRIVPWAWQFVYRKA
jgi:SAM-dependent methyltransferase